MSVPWWRVLCTQGGRRWSWQRRRRVMDFNAESIFEANRAYTVLVTVGLAVLYSTTDSGGMVTWAAYLVLFLTTECYFVNKCCCGFHMLFVFPLFFMVEQSSAVSRRPNRPCRKRESPIVAVLPSSPASFSSCFDSASPHYRFFLPAHSSAWSCVWYCSRLMGTLCLLVWSNWIYSVEIFTLGDETVLTTTT